MDNIKRLIQQHFTEEHITSIDTTQHTEQQLPNTSTEAHPSTSSTEENTENKEETSMAKNIKSSPSTKDTKIKEKSQEKMISYSPPIPSDPQLLELYNTCLICKACELCDSALNLVFGDGNPKAQIMVIGEAPGADEDEQGRPFVGRAGQLLIKLLNKYGVQREDIFIANILKHRPPNNRNPLSSEISACTPFLRKQIELIQPKLLITLGNFSSQYILETKVGITKIRGVVQESSYGMVLPTLHPSAIIRGAYPVDLLEKDVVTALQYVGYDAILED